MGHPRTAEKDHLYSPDPSDFPSRQRNYGAVYQYGRPEAADGSVGYRPAGSVQRDERRRIRYGYRIRPEHPALYQQLHHHSAADGCNPRSGAPGP